LIFFYLILYDFVILFSLAGCSLQRGFFQSGHIAKQS